MNPVSLSVCILFTCTSHTPASLIEIGKRREPDVDAGNGSGGNDAGGNSAAAAAAAATAATAAAMAAAAGAQLICDPGVPTCWSAYMHQYIFSMNPK